MRWLRSKRLTRCVAALLVAAMLPALYAPGAGAASNPITSSYAGWIRAQVMVPDDPAVARALEKASESGANTFERFVEAFLEAYEAQAPATPAARIFTERDLSNDALIVYLQRRYTEISAEAVLPRLRLVAASPAAPSSSSADPTNAAHAARAALHATSSNAVTPGVDDDVASLRPVTPARPQGP